MQPNSDASLKDMVHKAVIDGIMSGEFRPGQRITEKSLIEKCSVSKSPVRDAMIQLCNEKILRSIPRYGYEVLRLSEREIREVIEFRIALELYSFDAFAGSLTAEDLDELEQWALNAMMRRDSNDVWHCWETNRAFHLKLNSYLHNKYIYDQLEASLNVLTRAYMQIYWDEWRRVVISNDVNEHMDIIAHLRKGQVKEAKEILRSDICRIQKSLLK